jgi:hypothetical protein
MRAKIKDPFIAGCLIYKTFEPANGCAFCHEMLPGVRSCLQRMYDLSSFALIRMLDGYCFTVRCHFYNSSSSTPHQKFERQQELAREFTSLIESRVKKYVTSREGKNLKEVFESMKRNLESPPILDYGEYCEELIREKIMKEMM